MRDHAIAETNLPGGPQMEVRFPDGTIVRGSPLSDRDANQGWRQFGLYLDPGWRPQWPASTVEWPDFGVPTDPDQASEAIVEAFELARSGQKVEVGCIGGIGRTGTVLACMAVLAGVVPERAVQWVRDNYHPHAVEIESQREFVEEFAGRFSAWSTEEPSGPS